MLLCVSASHKTAPFELLERLSVNTDGVGAAIADHDRTVTGAVVVATCNRFEAYIDLDRPSSAASVAVDAVLAGIETATGVTADDLTGAYDVRTGDAVAEHLFAVASGLESVVVGEGEIAGQVRRALADARRAGTSSTELERLFQRASEAQRGVKNSTALGRAGRSLVRLALQLADSRIADWSTVRALLVGTGSYAAATVAALREHGVTDIAVFSPSGRAAPFAAKHAVRAVTALADAAAAADVIVTCTSVEHAVLSASDLRPPTSGRRLVIDLGLPRNVAPDVGAVVGHDLLDLETIRVHAPLDELEASDAARQVVADAAHRFSVVGERRSATPAIVALRSHVFALVDAEVERARLRGDDGTVEQALRHLAGVLLHTPTVRAHELAASGRADDVTAAVSALFGVDVPDAAAPPSAGATDLAG